MQWWEPVAIIVGAWSFIFFGWLLGTIAAAVTEQRRINVMLVKMWRESAQGSSTPHEPFATISMN